MKINAIYKGSETASRIVCFSIRRLLCDTKS